MIRIIVRYLILTVLCISLFLGYYLTETAGGLHLDLRLLASFLPGKLSIEKTEGKLFSGFSLKDISYQDKDLDVHIKSLDCIWKPRLLLSNILAIQHLHLHDVTIKTVSSTENRDWPIVQIYSNLKHLRLQNFAMDNFSILQDEKQTVSLRHITLQQQNIYDFVISLQGYLKNYPMQGDMQFSFTPERLSIKTAKLAIANTQAAFSGKVDKNWDLHWKITIPDLKQLNSASQGKLETSGHIIGPWLTPSISGNVEGNKIIFDKEKLDHIQGQVLFTFKPNTISSLSLTGYGIQVEDYKLAKLDLGLRGRLIHEVENYAAEFDLMLDNRRNVHAYLSIPKTITAENYLTENLFAKLNFNSVNLSEFKDYIPETKNVKGKVDGHFEFSGSISTPKLNGNIRLTQASLTIPKLGLDLKDINLNLLGNETRNITYQGSCHAQTGSIQIQGSTQLSEAGFPTQISLNGDHFTLVNLPEYKVVLSPNLKVQLSRDSLFVQGTVTVPEAKITPKDFRSTVTLPSDVVFVGEKKTTASNLLNFVPGLQIRVILGDKVFIHYQDLETSLRGQLWLSKRPENYVTAAGELYTVDGTYTAYGKSLKIQEGRLMYTGGIITNPGLNIKASRQIKTALSQSFGGLGQNMYGGTQLLTVGVQILGTLDSPKVSLFSDPSNLSQTTILSYLLLGIPDPQSGDDKAKLLNAASALNLAGNGKGTSQITNVTNKLKDTLGLSEFNVESVQTFDPTLNTNAGGTVGNTSLVLGKQIAHNLYIHSSVSLFATPPVYIFNVQYKLNKHWSIQSETSTLDTGADLLYSIERE